MAPNETNERIAMDLKYKIFLNAWTLANAAVYFTLIEIDMRYPNLIPFL